jgi:hypothetical protein
LYLLFCNLLVETNDFVLGAALLRAWFPSYWNHPHRNTNSGHFWSFNVSEISSWFQGTSVPSLVWICLSVLGL